MDMTMAPQKTAMMIDGDFWNWVRPPPLSTPHRHPQKPLNLGWCDSFMSDSAGAFQQPTFDQAIDSFGVIQFTSEKCWEATISLPQAHLLYVGGREDTGRVA